MPSDKDLLEKSHKQNNCHTHFVEKKASLVWKISGFTTRCPHQNRECLISPTFSIPGDDTRWFLDIYPKGNRGNDGYISLFLCSNTLVEVFITCELALISASGEKSMEAHFSRWHAGGYGYPRFISRESLLKRRLKLLPNDELTVSCTVTRTSVMTDVNIEKLKDDGSFCDVKSHSLIEDLGKLLDGNKNTDVVLKVNGEKIHAHKLLLICRSPVFAAMFDHNLSEKDTNEIVISDIEIGVMKELVRFMYTDVACFHDVAFALKLLIAADKYDVPSLKSQCAVFLSANVTSGDPLEVLMVADACNEKQLCRRYMLYIKCEMLTEMSFPEFVSKLNDRPEVLSVMDKLFNEKD